MLFSPELIGSAVAVAVTLVIVGFAFFSSKRQTTAAVTNASPSSSAASRLGDDEVEAVVARVADVLPSSMREVEVGDAGKVLLVNDGGQFFAVAHKCTHLGAPLVTGALSGSRVRCPWHGACFNVRTGDIEDYPCSDALQSHQVRVEAGQVIVRAKRAALATHKRTPDMCAASTAAGQPLFVIVGAGPAGLACAESLRQKGYAGRITIVGKEPHLPYDRTKLSKSMSSEAAKILLRPAAFFTQHNIVTRLGVSVVSLDSNTKQIALSDGTSLKYDGCLVATGGDPRRVTAPGSDLRNIHCLRVPEESHAILAAVEGKHLVVVGSSFIGMEAAAALRAKAASVTVIGMESVPFERVLGLQLGAAFQRLHEDNGVVFAMKRVVKEFRGAAGAVASVVLDDDTELRADLVVVGAGVIPATGFVTGVERQRDGSLLTDNTMRVLGADGLFAAGDIARYPYFLTDDIVRVEHYGMAMYQGALAGSNFATGLRTPITSVPFFWTTMYGKSLRYCGHAINFTDVIIHGDLASHKWVAFYVRDNAVLAVATMGRDPICSAAAELLGASRMPDAQALRAPGFAVESLLERL